MRQLLRSSCVMINHRFSAYVKLCERLSDVETNFLRYCSAGAAERVPRQHGREATGAALQLGSHLGDDVMRRRHLLGVVYRNILHQPLTAGHARHVTSGRRRVSMAARPGGGSVRVAPCMMHGWRVRHSSDH